MARRVYTIERFRSLLKDAEARFHHLRLHNITSKVADGSKGWPEQAPFDRIIVTAAADDIPQILVDQLAVGGVMVLPVGPDKGDQVLIRLRKTEEDVEFDHLADVRFVPMVAGALPEDDKVASVAGR